MIVRTAATILAAMALALSATLAGAQDATPVATEQLAVPTLPDPEQFCVYSGQLYSEGSLMRPENHEISLICRRALVFSANGLPNPLSWKISPEQDQAAAN